MAPRLGARRLIVYADDPAQAEASLAAAQLEYRGLGHAGSIKRLLRVFPALFRRDAVDVGVFQYMTPLAGRHIVFIHDLLPLTHRHLFPWKVRLRTRIFFSLAIRRAAVVIVVSDYTRREVARWYRLPVRRLRTVLNGPSFPIETYDLPPLEAAERYILTVGRIEPRKNIPLLVEALRQAAVPGVRLIVVGSFDLGFAYRPPADAPVEIRSGVSDEELIALYRGASLFAYPSEAEGFGVPLLDATLFGLPVLASDSTALPEVGGDLVEYFDPTAADAADALAQRIAGHFSDRPVRRPTPAERREQGERFSWDRAAEGFLAAVDQAVPRGAG